MNNERWADVVGWSGFYEVSDYGRVRSRTRLLESQAKGSLFNRLYRGQEIKPIRKKGTGYLCVTLRCHGLKVQAAIHVLVLEAFLWHRPDGFQACHNNGDRTDNRLVNLRWDSVAANQADKVKHGNSLCGEKNHNAKLTEDDVRAIRLCGDNQPSLARKYGVSQVLISRIRRRKAWQHVK